MGTSCIKMLIVTRRHNLSKVLECCLEHQVAKHPPAKRGTKQMTHPKPVSACGLVPLQPLKVCGILKGIDQHMFARLIGFRFAARRWGNGIQWNECHHGGMVIYVCLFSDPIIKQAH